MTNFITPLERAIAFVIDIANCLIIVWSNWLEIVQLSLKHWFIQMEKCKTKYISRRRIWTYNLSQLRLASVTITNCAIYLFIVEELSNCWNFRRKNKRRRKLRYRPKFCLKCFCSGFAKFAAVQPHSISILQRKYSSMCNSL